jgi:hypothetical protein
MSPNRAADPIEQMGIATWPLGEHDIAALEDASIIEYVEGLFQLASKPTASWFHSYCGSSHPTEFDKAAGRYKYTVMVNTLFERFGTGYRLQNGKVRSAISSVLSPRLSDALPFGGDTHLAMLVGKALGRFTSSDSQQRWEALRLLADAYERIKTIKDPTNKKASVGELIKSIAPEEEIARHVDALFFALTSASNDLTIRHHEVGKVKITEDAELIDFLFYSHYNIIRLALHRLFGGV